MHTFKDTAGREWTLEINVPSRRQCITDTTFDLFAVVEADQLKRLEDPELLVAVLFSLCGGQAKVTGVTPEQFARSISGDVLDQASEALMGALADFFPSRQRAVMKALLAKGKEIEAAQAMRAMARLEALDVGSLLDAMSSEPATSSPASSESTSAG